MSGLCYICLLSSIVIFVVYGDTSVDQTMTPDAKGCEVAKASIDKVIYSRIFKAVTFLLIQIYIQQLSTHAQARTSTHTHTHTHKPHTHKHPHTRTHTHTHTHTHTQTHRHT